MLIKKTPKLNILPKKLDDGNKVKKLIWIKNGFDKNQFRTEKSFGKMVWHIFMKLM